MGYDKADNRGYFTVGGDGDLSLTVVNDGAVGINTNVPVEKLGVAGNMRFVNATGETKRISALPSGSYNLGTTGGSAIAFHRISDGGGGSDEIAFETHYQGNRHAESARISKFGGITFNGDTAAANALDDYEEGTFNAPYYQGGNLVANADGRYTKIGNRVMISVFEFVDGQSSKSDKDILYITGLPFNARSEPHSLGTIARFSTGNHQTISVAEHCYIAQGGTQIKFDDTFNSGTGQWAVSLVYEAA